MAKDDRLWLLLADLDRTAGAGALTALMQEGSTLLFGTPGVPSALVSDGEMDEELRLTVFHILVDEARTDMENRSRLGKCFLAKATEAIASLGEAAASAWKRVRRWFRPMREPVSRHRRSWYRLCRCADWPRSDWPDFRAI